MTLLRPSLSGDQDDVQFLEDLAPASPHLTQLPPLPIPRDSPLPLTQLPISPSPAAPAATGVVLFKRKQWDPHFVFQNVYLMFPRKHESLGERADEDEGFSHQPYLRSSSLLICSDSSAELNIYPRTPRDRAIMPCTRSRL